ncbi:signal peptidase I [Fonsecaea nubica]|uniref:Mitochondrial inner membrane protease subunit 2 n=1 Tax=Fonsecaea nubica TaxID=856822 RepID=A0A178CKV9_9EURO|nr:signal peptidase I [Fonsecaea nubica]OAL29732.1 signal peptidase I [Fonsecaea nubica]
MLSPSRVLISNGVRHVVDVRTRPTNLCRYCPSLRPRRMITFPSRSAIETATRQSAQQSAQTTGAELGAKKPGESDTRHSSIWRFARSWTWRLFVIAPPLLVLFMSFPFTIMRVQGASMAPLFNINSSPHLPPTAPDVILVKKVKGIEAFPNLTRDGSSRLTLKRGQIVVFYAPHDPTKLAVKRVIGVPGDRVKPLPGYPGGDDPVIVPYNHIWVEGDANSREKSMDSNYFGPLSQNMVLGLVTAVLPPWAWPVAVRGDEHDYPAKTSGRLEKDVVQHAKLDPDTEASKQDDPFEDGRAAIELAMMRQNRDHLITMIRDKSKFDRMKTMYERAKTELQHGTDESREVASGLVEELQVLFESVGLNKDGSAMPPALRSLKEGRTDEGNLEKQKRLDEYLARQRQASNDGIGSQA